MNKNTLATKRPWNWKVFIILAGLIILAAFAIVPYSLHLIHAYGTPGDPGPEWGTVVRNALINSLIVILIGGLGLLISNRIGIGLPFMEGWVGGKSSKFSFYSMLAVSMITGCCLAGTYLILQDLVFGPPMEALFQDIGYILPDDALTPPLYGFLAAISAGITEETIFRLFGLSLLAWLGGFLFHDSEGRPTLAVFWTANILFALAFGAMHLQDAATRGWPLNSLIIIRTLTVNGIGGLALGWLFWSFGLECAMLAHFFSDVILYALIPVIALQQNPTTSYGVALGVVLCNLLALFWAWRRLVLENRKCQVGS
jgi:hypothetical protein